MIARLRRWRWRWLTRRRHINHIDQQVRMTYPPIKITGL